jgi:hypothetical protein
MPLTRLMFIRGAEKLAVDDCRVTHQARYREPAAPRLQRAGALVRFFGPQSTAKDDNGLAPDVVFAPRVGPRSESARAIEIVTPLVDCWEKLGRRP